MPLPSCCSHVASQGQHEFRNRLLEAANKLVNSTVDQNQVKVDLVIGGLSSREELYAEFGSPTGYEAYARTERSTPYIRETDGVLVVIVPDEISAKGYRVLTAYPVNR